MSQVGVRSCIDRYKNDEWEDNMRQVILFPGEDGFWVTECPSLPGCISQGETKEEALSNIREAIQGYVAALAQDNLPVPEDRFDVMVVSV